MSKCKALKCDIKSYSLGYCRKHHARFKRNGTSKSLYDKVGYDPLDHIKDVRPGHRGYLAVNIINDIKFKAVKRGKTWEIGHVFAFNLITNPCIYCGFVPSWPSSRVGIDRVDNNIGYIESNCVPCCFTCNSAKGTLSRDAFIEWIKKIFIHTSK